jgi:hypothetical protein
MAIKKIGDARLIANMDESKSLLASFLVKLLPVITREFTRGYKYGSSALAVLFKGLYATREVGDLILGSCTNKRERFTSFVRDCPIHPTVGASSYGHKRWEVLTKQILRTPLENLWV